MSAVSQWAAAARGHLHIQWSCADSRQIPGVWSHLSSLIWSLGMDDDLVCEYDSTWDTESDGDELENTGRSKKTRPAFVCYSLSLICELIHCGTFLFYIASWTRRFYLRRVSSDLYCVLDGQSPPRASFPQKRTMSSSGKYVDKPFWQVIYLQSGYFYGLNVFCRIAF